MSEERFEWPKDCVTMLDLGEIRRVVCVEPGHFDDCEIEVVGTKGARRYSTECILSRNRFQGAGEELLWNVRTEYLLAQWQKCGHRNNLAYSLNERIKLPSTLKAMEWARETASEPLAMSIVNPFAILQGNIVKWVDAHGERVPEPKWFRPMYGVYLMYGVQNAYRHHRGGRDAFERMYDEYVVMKLVLDAYAENLNSDLLNGETFEEMSLVCEGLRALVRRFNKQVENGTLSAHREEWNTELGEWADNLGTYNFCNVHCDFDDAMKECISRCKAELLKDCPCRVENVQRYTPFRYPGTQVAFNMW